MFFINSQIDGPKCNETTNSIFTFRLKNQNSKAKIYNKRNLFKLVGLPGVKVLFYNEIQITF